MQVLVCTVDVMPCPVGSEAWIQLAQLIDFESLGITPEILAYALSAGFAIPFGSYLLGFGIAIALNLIRQVGP